MTELDQTPKICLASKKLTEIFSHSENVFEANSQMGTCISR
jgi:hypothetical protein